MYFPPGTFLFSDVTLPDESTRGAHVFCAGRDVTTLQLNADNFMFATYNYANNQTTGAGSVEINGCTIDLDDLNASLPGIIIEGTNHSQIYDNLIENGHLAALELTSKDYGTGTGDGACTTAANGDTEIIQNVFKSSDGPAIKGLDDGCAGGNEDANGLSDVLIKDNIFSANAGGGSGVSPDYQVTTDWAAGWSYRGNKSFDSTGCGDLHMVSIGSSVITNNRFDVTANSVCSSKLESVVLEMSSSKGFTFSDNALKNTATSLPGGVSTWDALEIVDSTGSKARGTVGDNEFSNKNSFSFNAINYNGTYASGSPLAAIGNAYTTNVTAPDPSNSSIILGTDQYLTMKANATQAVSSTKYFPVTGFTTSASLTQPNATQSWAQAGTFSVVASNCGQLGTAPGTGNTYTFTLVVNASAVGLTCTFSGTSTTGTGSGSASVSVGDAVEWKAVQSTTSVAANPTVSLIFVRL